MFEQLDTDNSGSISIAELVPVLFPYATTRQRKAIVKEFERPEEAESKSMNIPPSQRAQMRALFKVSQASWTLSTGLTLSLWYCVAVVRHG